MKRICLLLVFLFGTTALIEAQGNWSFKGTVIKMRMADCTAQQHGFISTMSGAPSLGAASCPEYTITSDKVVYVVQGRQKDAFIPMAENIVFLIRKNELVTFSDDEKSKSHFAIQQMTLRTEWDREEARKDLETKMMERSTSYESRNPPRTSMLSTSSR
jgi:hypothetical protein